MISGMAESHASFMAVSPNPSKGDFVLNLNKNYRAVKVEISAIEGKIVEELNYNSVQSVNIYLSRPAGIYLCRVEINGFSETKKIIKTN